jgi:nucleoside-diphosphate-sugar epimerase
MEKTYKQILVTGCLGTVGRQLCKELRKDFPKANILGVDISYAQKPKELDWYYRLDLSSDIDLVVLKRLVLGVDTVIHTAASLDLDADKEFLYNINVKPVKIIAETLKEVVYKTKLPVHFIHFSSCSIYDLNSKGPYTEASPLFGSNNYELSKIESEKVILDVAKSLIGRGDPSLEYLFGYTIIRPGMIYGPGQKSLSATAICLGSLISKLRVSFKKVSPKSNWASSLDLARAVVYIIKTGPLELLNVAEPVPAEIGSILNEVIFASVGACPYVSFSWPTKLIKTFSEQIALVLPTINKVIKLGWKVLRPSSPVIPKIDRGALPFGYLDAEFNSRKLGTTGFIFNDSIIENLTKTIEWYYENKWI